MRSVKLSINTVDTAISSLKLSQANVESQINLLNNNLSAVKDDFMFSKEDISRKILLLEYELTCIKNALAEAEAIFWQTVKEHHEEKDQNVSKPEFSFDEMRSGETSDQRI